MPSLDPRRSVVLALHFQNDIAHESGKMGFGTGAKRANVVGAARRLIEGARAAGVPVVSVRVAYRADYADVFANSGLFRTVVERQALQDGTWGAEFVEGLEPRPDEFVVTHRRVNPFYGSALEEVVNKLGAHHIVIAGVATNYVVDHAARHACDVGHDVVVVSDACSTSAPEAHEATLSSLRLLATIATVDEVIAGWRGTPSP